MTEPANPPAASVIGPAPEASRRPRGVNLVLAGLLFAATFLAYLPSLRFDFVNYDDPEYVTDNARVKSGLTVTNITWAFTTDHAGNWHPLTWLSHQADVACFGVRPGAHHFSNVLFHAVNTVLLFWLLHALTGSRWRSALVAALFALHPAHVESVAWISERKDVLSALFGLLALLAYARATREPERLPAPESPAPPNALVWRSSWYWLAVILLALGLMTKPMLVTLPCLMLLLDYWPLRRFQHCSWPRLFLEKLPCFAMVAASCIITFIVQKHGGAVQTLRELSLEERLGNAVVSYARYVGKAVWPVNLATPYPHPGGWPISLIIVSVATLIVLSLLAWFSRRRLPYITVGWLWFIGMLVPVIGLVQVGAQSMADRYTYLPYIGLFVAVVWAANHLLNQPQTVSAPAALSPAPATRFTAWQWLLGLLALGLLAALTIKTQVQLRVWQNSETLFRHAVSVTSSNWVAWYNLGWHLDTAGRVEEALACYRKAVEIDPKFPDPMNNIGCALAALKRYDEAIPCFEAALKLQPSFLEAHINVANALRELGRSDEAIARYRFVLEKKPNHTGALNSLGNLLARQNKFAEVIPVLESSLAANPDQPATHYTLANALVKMRRAPEAIAHYERALVLKPDYQEARHDLGLAYAFAGRLDDAAALLRDAAAKDPKNVQVRLTYGRVLVAQQKTDAAISLFNEALKLDPESAEAHANLGPLLAMKGELAEAITHLQKAVHARPTDVNAQFNLGKALAALGRKEEAMAALQEALRLRPNHAQAADEIGRLRGHD
jgi:tetratricopeptide (TPR) repeat protein